MYRNYWSLPSIFVLLICSVAIMLFPSSTTIATKLERMRAAETRLIQLATQFGGREIHDYTMELLDTPIPASVIPLKDRAKESEELTIHGIKLVSKIDGTNVANYPLVLLHGYMNGAMYFYRNLVGLTNYFPTIYSLDALGWGLSSRPKWSLQDDSIKTAEDFFVESLEAWRSRHNIDKMILAGHSMGGYISVAYCERYPDRVDRLILLSPVGVPVENDDPQNTRKWSFQRWVFKTLFESGTTPCSAMRTFSETRGRSYVSTYIDRRIPAITDIHEKEAVTDYLYQNMMLPGSGEYCLNRLLTMHAFGKQPTVHRIPNLKVKSVSFLYGESDWMDPEGGLAVQRNCEHRFQQGEESPVISVYEVKNAGHLLMLDNWEEFNSAVILAGGGQVSNKAPLPLKLFPRQQHGSVLGVTFNQITTAQ
jgi:cardiolipin-specific phospholipase